MVHRFVNFVGEAPGFVQLSFWVGTVTLGITVICFFALVWLRLLTSKDARIREQLNDKWQPIFLAMKKKLPVSQPSVLLQEEPYFLELWLQERELANSDYGKALDDLAEHDALVNTVEYLTRLYPIKLLAPDASKVVIATRAARWISSEQILRNLYDLADADNLPFAIQACESLLYLDDPEAPHLVVRLLFRFPEHDKYITTRLGAAGGEKVIRVLGPFLDHMPNARLQDVIYLIERSGDKGLIPLLEKLFTEDRSDEERASILRALGNLGSVAQRDLVLPYLNSEIAFLKLQAASALSVVGLPEDRERLVPLLSDEDWWVRYRAAESFIAMWHEGEEQLRAFIAAQQDKFARDILVHTLGERSWHTS